MVNKVILWGFQTIVFHQKLWHEILKTCISLQTGDEMSRRVKFMMVTWVGRDVSPLKRAKMSTDKALVKEILSVNTLFKRFGVFIINVIWELTELFCWNGNLHKQRKCIACELITSQIYTNVETCNNIFKQKISLHCQIY